MKIIYITTEGVSSTVFYSQVYSFCKRIKCKNIDIKILNFQKVPFNFFSKQSKYLLKWPFIKTYFYREFDISLSKKIEKHIGKRNVILHCRNPHAALLGFEIQGKYKNVSVLYDVRGISELEQEFHGNNVKALEYNKINSKLFKTPGLYYNFVSNELKKYYEDVYNTIFTNYVICPSVYNDCEIINYNVSSYNKKSFIYIGGNQKYQNIERIINLFRNKPDCKLIVVTHEKINNTPSYTNVNFLHNLDVKKMYKIAQKCDYGIIYRNCNQFNQVATPTKISEYWGNGLKVLAINNAGAYTDNILKNPFLGYVINENQINSICKLQKTNFNEKGKLISYAKTNYSLTSNTSEYIDFYEKIFKD